MRGCEGTDLKHENIVDSVLEATHKLTNLHSIQSTETERTQVKLPQPFSFAYPLYVGEVIDVFGTDSRSWLFVDKSSSHLLSVFFSLCNLCLEKLLTAKNLKMLPFEER